MNPRDIKNQPDFSSEVIAKQLDLSNALNERDSDEGLASRVRVMMAVPQYPYPIIGGLERQSHELAKALIQKGIEVQAVSGRTRTGQAAREDVEGVLVHRITWSKKKWLRFLSAPFSLIGVLFTRRHTYDVVHLHQFSWFGLFLIVIAKLLGKPILTKLANVGEFGIPGLLASSLGRLKLSILLQSDAIVAMSQESIQELESVGFSNERIFATPNGISTHPKTSLRANSPLKKNTSPEPTEGLGTISSKNPHRLHVHGSSESEQCRVVYVGRLVPQKGVDDLLAAWSQTVDSVGKSVELQLWGTGHREQCLRQQCQELNIDNSVVFSGYVESVRSKLEDADIFVLPSHAEGNSNAVLEAMAAGLPVIGTRVGGTPMLVGPDGAEFLVEPGDSAGLASCLKRLIQDDALRNRLGMAMRERANDLFNLQRVANSYAEAYARLSAGERDRIGELSNPVVRECGRKTA